MGLIPFYVQTALSAIIAGVSFYRLTERDTVVKFIGLIFLISCLFNCVLFLALVVFKIPIINQIGTLYVFVHIIICTVWYGRVLSKRFTKMLVVTSSIVICWGVIVVFFVYDTGEPTTLLNLGASFLWLLYSIIYFYRLMQDLPTIHVHRLPTFWFNCFFLIYASGTIVLLAAYDYLVRVHVNIWLFNTALFIVGQFIVMVGLYYDFRSAKGHESSGSVERSQKQFLQK